jgi:hypothetical protein
MTIFRRALLATMVLIATPASARDSLGVFGTWGAFRDPGVPRCYAIAMADPAPGPTSAKAREFQPYFTVGTWPGRGTRGEIHVRLSRRTGGNRRVVLNVDGQSFDLLAGQADAWSQDRRMDAAIVAAMRSATDMTVTTRATNGKLVRDTYRMAGAATAMDSAMIGCAGR